MRRWLLALPPISLALLFPLAVAYAPYDHWDHTWPSVNLVFALGLLCVTVCAAVVLAQSAISLTRRLLLGVAAGSAIAACLDVPSYVIIADDPPDFGSPYDAVATALTIMLAIVPGILAKFRRRFASLRTVLAVDSPLEPCAIGAVISTAARPLPLRI